MSDYLEKRRQLYYAVLTVPKTLQADLGLRFVKSTSTGDRRRATIIASQLVAGLYLFIITLGQSLSDLKIMLQTV